MYFPLKVNRHDFIYTGRITTGKLVTVSSDKTLTIRELNAIFIAYMDESPKLSPTVKEKFNG